MRRIYWLVCLISATCGFCSCSTDKVKYRIGVSQCSDDIWRDKQNAELRMGAYFHDNVELKFAAAYDSDERQVQQIDSLVRSGIDLLIVAPNQVQTISPAIDRAYDKGIPVIVFERKTSSQKYTAFISADNYEMGRTMGEYIASQLAGKGRVMEVMGLKGSSPAIERHKGFADAIAQHPGIEVVATLQGDWTEESAYDATKQWLDSVGSHVAPIDFVFAQNDRMAMGAREALAPPSPPEGGTIDNPSKFKTIEAPSGAVGGASLFCGIDGLPGEGGGIQLVRDSVLDATYIYPTHGDRILELALDILEGRPYDKETRLMSALVTRQNARVLLMQDEEIIRKSVYLDQLHQKADGYLQALDTQRVINWLAMGIIVLLVVVFVLFYLYHLRKIALQRERVVNTLWNMPSAESELQPAASTAAQQPAASTVAEDEPEEQSGAAEEVQPEEASVTTAAEATSEETVPPVEEPTADATAQTPPANGGVAGGLFLTRFREVVETRLNDSDLSVDDLAADMNLSRVQLYRKVKSVTGSSPVELLRTARLNRAYQLLLTTDKTVSEVAYAVGFTAPSYFTKCFKDEYGMVPGDVRK